MLRPSLKAGKAIFLAAVQQFSRDAAQKTLDPVTYSGISRVEPRSDLGQKGTRHVPWEWHSASLSEAEVLAFGPHGRL